VTREHNVIVFDPDEISRSRPGEFLKIAGEPPVDSHSRRAVATYREFAALYGVDTRGLPKLGPMTVLSVVCNGGQRSRRGHVLANASTSARASWRCR